MMAQEAKSDQSCSCRRIQEHFLRRGSRALNEASCHINEAGTRWSSHREHWVGTDHTQSSKKNGSFQGEHRSHWNSMIGRILLEKPSGLTAM